MFIQPKLLPARAALIATLMLGAVAAQAADSTPKVDDFAGLVKRLQAEKPQFAERQRKLLEDRYDLSDRAAAGATMSRGKPVQDGVRVKLPAGTTGNSSRACRRKRSRQRNLWPAGFFPLPHPHHEAGGMIFPKPLIDETKKQTQRDLTRFDLDFDLPEHLLPEFPAPIFLTTRPDLGDVSKGQLVTLDELLSTCSRTS